MIVKAHIENFLYVCIYLFIDVYMYVNIISINLMSKNTAHSVNFLLLLGKMYPLQNLSTYYQDPCTIIVTEYRVPVSVKF